MNGHLISELLNDSAVPRFPNTLTRRNNRVNIVIVRMRSWWGLANRRPVNDQICDIRKFVMRGLDLQKRRSMSKS